MDINTKRQRVVEGRLTADSEPQVFLDDAPLDLAAVLAGIGVHERAARAVLVACAKLESERGEGRWLDRVDIFTDGPMPPDTFIITAHFLALGRVCFVEQQARLYPDMTSEQQDEVLVHYGRHIARFFADAYDRRVATMGASA